MELMKKLFKFYVFSNLHVAFAGFCLTRIAEIRLGLKAGYTPYFVFFSIVISYNFIRYYEIKTNRLIWLKSWFKNHLNYISILALFSFIGVVFLIISQRIIFNAVLTLIPFALMTFFYVIPLVKIGGKEISFRNFPGVKIFSIAIAWAGVTVLFPVINDQLRVSSLVWLYCGQQFFFLMAYTIPFDIRDVNSDDVTLKTLPQVLGVHKSKLFGIFCILLFLLINYINYQEVSLSELLISLLLGIFMLFSSSKRNRIYTGFWVEATPIIWLALILLF